MSGLEEFVQTVVPLFNFTVLVILLVSSRRWTGPGLSVRVESLEHDTRVLSGNVARIDRDLTALSRGVDDQADQLLREIRDIRQMLEGDVTIRRQFEKLADEFEELKTLVKAIPCAVNPNCVSNIRST